MIKYHVYSNLQSSWGDDYYISSLKNNIFKLIRRRVGDVTDWKAYIKFTSPKDFLDRLYNNNVFDSDIDHSEIIKGLKKHPEFILLALVINKYQEEITNKVYSEEEELFIKDSVFKLDNFPSSNTGFKRRFKKDKISSFCRSPDRLVDETSKR